MSGTCESCGRIETHLDEVHRVYVTPESWDTEGDVEVVAEIEMWCTVCQLHYPHRPVAWDGSGASESSTGDPTA